MPESFARRPTVTLFRALNPDVPVGIEHENCVVLHSFDQQTEALLSGPQRFFGPAAFLDLRFQFLRAAQAEGLGDERHQGQRGAHRPHGR